MLARFATALLLSVALGQALAASPTQIVGSWQSDDGQAYSEIHFRPDYSFTFFSRTSMKNPELAVTELAEQFGTWRVEDHQLKLDSTQRRDIKRTRISLQFNLTNDRLRMQRVYDPAKTDTYTRLSLPSCAEGTTAAALHVSTEALIGRWRGHCRTHDTEFSFEASNRASLYAWDLGDRRKFEDATWHLSKNVITIKPKDSFMADSQIRWTIIHIDDKCLVVSDGSEMSYTLQRIE